MEPYKIGVLGWTKSSVFRRHILTALGGTEAKNISQAAFLDGPFPDCSLDALESFTAEITRILSAISLLEDRSRRFESLRALFINRFLT